MPRLALILATCLLTIVGRATASNPTTHPTTAPATQLTLKPIELHYEIRLARLEHHITISPDGSLRSVRTTNKSYGPNDLDPKHERIEIREGKLTPDQISDLARKFTDWIPLTLERNGNVPDGPAISIRYGDRTISSGGEQPAPVTEIQTQLIELARAMPVVSSRGTKLLPVRQ